jgi:lipopolysaccharide export system protein LptA
MMRTALSLSLLLLASSTAAFAQTAAAPQAPAAKPPANAASSQAPVKKPQAGAASGLGFGKHDSNAPINVSSERFEGDLNTKVGTYLGNVLVIQGEMRMRADKVKVNVTQGKPTRIEADGKVVVNAPNGTATGDTGVYDLGPRTITMTGHVVLNKEKDVMRGSKLVMDMNTGLAHLTAQGTQGGRVQGLFIPPPQQNGNGTAPAAAKKPAQPGTP